jgi:hypothetical protein
MIHIANRETTHAKRQHLVRLRVHHTLLPKILVPLVQLRVDVSNLPVPEAARGLAFPCVAAQRSSPCRRRRTILDEVRFRAPQCKRHVRRASRMWSCQHEILEEPRRLKDIEWEVILETLTSRVDLGEHSVFSSWQMRPHCR